jgi:AmmeMemoRadiSam system protein A
VSEREITETEIGNTLLEIARGTLNADLADGPAPSTSAVWLQKKGACFVTLNRRGYLRGCIGSITAYRPLAEDVVANARAAAFGDPRFPPLEARELVGLSLEVSLLSDLELMVFDSEADLLQQIRPGEDGLLLEYGSHRGTFLPTVWGSLPDRQLFLNKLKAKAGLSEDIWSPEILVQRYTTRSWSDAETDA